VTVSSSVLEEAKGLAAEHVARVAGHFHETLRPQMARVLMESAAVAVRAAFGEDVTTATIALNNSVAQLTREQQALVEKEGRDLALRAALALISRLVLLPKA
jgi:hypothetical protein